MAIYMQINDILGDVSAQGHEQWILLLGLEFSTKRSLIAEPGRISDREATRPSITELSVHKKMDKSSPLLFSESCIGKAKAEIKIHICQTGSSLTPYMQYQLANAIICGYEVNATYDQYPNEIIRFSFDKIEMRYTPFDEKHQALSPIPAGYDLKKAVAI
jgi:type VI secretion system secreted protein Hcp